MDHFRPKSHAAFHELVCAWSNLFLTCTACNHAKREQWEEALLRPDDADFRFERYFEVRFDSGELEPAAVASVAEQHRALRTIEILALNRADNDSWAYRYLLPLCRAA